MVEMYKVFDVRTTVVPKTDLPVWEELKGNRVDKIVDINNNGVPDKGDVAITIRAGNSFGTGFVIGNIEGNLDYSVGNSIVNMGWVREYADLTAAPRDCMSLPRGGWSMGAEELAVSIKGYGSGLITDAKAIGSSVSENLVIAGALAGVIGLAALHPYGRAALETVGAAGSVGGGAFIAGDRVNGIYNGEPMGEHDLSAMLAMFGGAAAFEGVVVKTASYASRASAYLAGMFEGAGSGGLMVMAPATAGVSAGVRGSIALDTVAVGAGSSPAPAAGGLGAASGIAMMQDAGGGARSVEMGRSLPPSDASRVYGEKDEIQRLIGAGVRANGHSTKVIFFYDKAGKLLTSLNEAYRGGVGPKAPRIQRFYGEILRVLRDQHNVIERRTAELERIESELSPIIAP